MGYRNSYVEGSVRDRNRGCGCGSRGCSSCNVAGAGTGSRTNCVKDVVRRILDAQREVAGGGLHDCDTSCDRSIDELLSPSRGERGRFTTIPFMLICKDKCKTFYGAGFRGHGAEMERRGRYECIESPVFKVQGFVRGSNNCVRLELLLPVYRRRDGDNDQRRHHDSCGSDVCNHFGHHIIENWRHTGVCITVDLDCFCGISCLDPTTPREFEN